MRSLKQAIAQLDAFFHDRETRPAVLARQAVIPAEVAALQ
jgi:hypothetical protein